MSFGKKTAEGLLRHFGSLDDIYDNLDRVHEVNVRGAKTLGAKLETHRDDAMLARQLTGIACDAPIEDAEAALQPSAPRLGEINALSARILDLNRQIVSTEVSVPANEKPSCGLRNTTSSTT